VPDGVVVAGASHDGSGGGDGIGFLNSVEQSATLKLL
jgi:hypothetical protein